jgi:hypothetical protein
VAGSKWGTTRYMKMDELREDQEVLRATG